MKIRGVPIRKTDTTYGRRQHMRTQDMQLSRNRRNVRTHTARVQAYAKYVGLARTIYIYGVHPVFLAGNLPNIRSCMVYIYDSSQS